MGKTCIKCGESKSPVDYYGKLNECKECTKKRVRENRVKKIEYYRDYDRKRGNRQPPGYLREYRARNPNKYKATTMVNNAIRGGKLFPEPCSECGSEDNLNAHHDDYAKPLNVRWLCSACHHQWHRDNGEGANS